MDSYLISNITIYIYVSKKQCIHGGVSEFSKNLGATSKFWTPEGQHKTCSIVRPQTSGVTFEPHWNLSRFARHMWTDKHFCVQEIGEKNSNNYTEKFRRDCMKLSRPVFVRPCINWWSFTYSVCLFVYSTQPLNSPLPTFRYIYTQIRSSGEVVKKYVALL